MNTALRVFCMLVSGVAFFGVIYQLVKRRMNESHSILWFVVVILMLIIGFYPDMVSNLAAMVYIDYPPTLLFLVSTIVLMLISFKGSVDISNAEKRISETAIIVSLLQEENARLRRLLKEKEQLHQ